MKPDRRTLAARVETAAARMAKPKRLNLVVPCFN